MSAKLEAGDGRKRQSKRDDQIRRKLESEIAKRRSKVGQTPKVPKRAKGSVMTLKPLPPLTMTKDTTVMDASQYMSAHRANCVLVLDNDGAVCGIFTAKDLAFKVVGTAGGRDRRTTTVEHIMTPNPTCADINSSATDALNLMVSRGFRHLPVMDDDGEIAGVLDITKCFFEAMQKLERAYESSRKLHDALEGVQNELGTSQPAKFMNYVQALKRHTAGPDLSSVLDGRLPIYVDVRTSVAEAASLMRENRTTAVLVVDKSAITGIFTSKDVVLRVLSAGIEPTRCSVVRVMTPQPDMAPTSMSIQDALRKMHDGHYLNLPVSDADGNVVGIVDVLRLTYATLEQINSMSEKTEEGPAWNKFWMSLDDDTESNSSVPTAIDDLENGNDWIAEVSESELAQFSIPEIPSNGSDHMETARSLLGTDLDEVVPEDSMSRAGSSIDNRREYDITYTKPPINYGTSVATSNDSANSKDTFTFSFKFKAPNGRAHRIAVTEATTLQEFREFIIAKLGTSDLEKLGGCGELMEGRVVSGFAVSYLDDDKDLISITTKEDIAEAVAVSRRNRQEKSDIYLHHAEETPTIELPKGFDFNDLPIPLVLGGVALAAFAVFALQRRN